jgi:hypothetical protein
MARFKVLGGDFKAKDSYLYWGTLSLYDPRKNSFSADTNIPLTEVTAVEVATEENVKRVGGTIGWAAAGGLLLGPLGLIGGALLGGRGKDITFICTLRDGRGFLATASSEVYKQFLAASVKSVASARKAVRSVSSTQTEPGGLEAWSLPQPAASRLLDQLLNREGHPTEAPKRAVGEGRLVVTTSAPAAAVRRIHSVISTFCDGEAEPPWGIRYSIGTGSSRRMVGQLDLALGRLHFSRTTLARTERQVLNFSGYKMPARPRKSGNWVSIPTDRARLQTLLEVLEATLPQLTPQSTAAVRDNR